MLDALRFVQGSIDKKGLVAELLHYRIQDGFVRGYNGRISLCSPIETDLDITPQGLPFMKAIAASNETIALSVTESNRVAVKSGRFRVYIPQAETPFPDVTPDGELQELPHGDLISTFKSLLSFTAEDASRPWATGILFKGSHAYATNNVLLVDYDVGVEFPGIINVPKQTVREMVRLKENPTHVQIGEGSITFHYPGGRWLRSNALSSEWPDIDTMLDTYDWTTLNPIPEELFPVLNTLHPFANDLSQLFVETNRLSTERHDTEGASIDIEMFGTDGCFNIDQLLKLENIVTDINLAYYPKPCPFVGDSVRGLIIGMRT